MSKLLIVVDFQNDFVTGSLGTPWAREVSPNIEKKIKECYYKEGKNIIFTQDTHFIDYLETNEGKNLPVQHCRFNSEGWKIVNNLQAYATMTIEKFNFGYIEWYSIIGKEEAVNDCIYNEIEIIGLCTDVCVISNALILKTIFPEVDIIVDASCCAGTTPEKHQAALKILESCQIKVINKK